MARFRWIGTVRWIPMVTPVGIHRSAEIEVLGKCNRPDGDTFWRHRYWGPNLLYPAMLHIT